MNFKYSLLIFIPQLIFSQAVFSASHDANSKAMLNAVKTPQQLSFDKICQSHARPGKTKTGQYKKECIRTKRFSSYKSNYALMKYSNIVDNKFDRAIEFNFSFRYLITEPDCVTEFIDYDTVLDDISKDNLLRINHCLENFKSRHEWFVKYSGQFDFYAFTKPSSPVINRLSNPGLHYRKYIKIKCIKKQKNTGCQKKYVTIRWFDIAIEHRSNGQTLDFKDKTNQRFKTEIEYEKNYNDFENYNYFDYLSRSSNYLTLANKLLIDLSKDNSSNCYKIHRCFTMWSSMKIYDQKSLEFDVNWGSNSNQNAKIEDYDRYNIIIQTTVGKLKYGFEYTMGDRMFETDSAELFLTLKTNLFDYIELPFYFRTHSGPMSTLSNYTKDERTYGIGLVF